VLIAATTYEWFLSAHILAAVIWVGGGFASQVYALRAQRAGPGRVTEFAGDIEWLGTHVFIPASLTVVVFGFLAAEEGNWPWEFWLYAGLAVWTFSFLLGAGFLGPESGRINKMGAELGPEHPDVQARLNRIFWISRIELVLLLLIVVVMTLKPGV
jgi:uncharacterized membrane protein